MATGTKSKSALKSLTTPQYCLLVDISERPETIVESYPPARKLIGLGYARFAPLGFGSCSLIITDAGREALRNG